MKEFKKSPQLEKMIDEFKAIKEELSVEQNHLENTLAGLKQELPPLLLGMTLGEVTVIEVGNAKQEIAKVQERLTDIPLIIKAIKKGEAEIQEKMSKIRKKSDLQIGEKKYKKLIVKIKDTTLEYNKGLDSEIRSTAQSIGKAKEAHEIVESWKNRLTQTPVEAL